MTPVTKPMVKWNSPVPRWPPRHGNKGSTSSVEIANIAELAQRNRSTKHGSKDYGLFGFERALGPRCAGWGPPESGLTYTDSEEAPGGGEPYARLRAVGRVGRGGRCRRRRARCAAGGAHSDATPAAVWEMRRGGLVQGDQPGELGGPTRVRAPGAPHLAQVALALPDGELSGRLVHRDR